MYLSRVDFDLRHRALRRAGSQALTGPYGLHRAMWDLFSDGPQRQRDFLYRFDSIRGSCCRVLALSQRPPLDEGAWHVETKPFRPRLSSGTLLSFRLRANPVVTRAGKRHDVVMDERARLDQEGVPKQRWPSRTELARQAGTKWLARRGEGCGFRLLEEGLRVDSYEVQRFSKRSEGGRRISHGICDFAGVLEVVESSAFLEAVGRGIGPAKGFGCGLLLLARYRGAPG